MTSTLLTPFRDPQSTSFAFEPLPSRPPLQLSQAQVSLSSTLTEQQAMLAAVSPSFAFR
jgi:hypothetical protein